MWSSQKTRGPMKNQQEKGTCKTSGIFAIPVGP